MVAYNTFDVFNVITFRIDDAFVYTKMRFLR